MTTSASVNDLIQVSVAGSTPESVCSADLAKGPWEFDVEPPSYGPGSSMGDVIPTGSPVQGGLPAEYKTATN
ncbi:MAG: quinolinate synthase, partial [Alpinimonas sp.]